MSASTSTTMTQLKPRTRAEGPETILIIGGGATGLVTLRNLIQETGHDDQGEYPLFAPQLVERRDDVGGVWYWSDETYKLERQVGVDKTQGLSPLYDPQGHPHWPSPAYLNLRGNVLPEFLEFSGKKFDPPARGETFPSLHETHEYLKSFADPYRSHIRCGVEVLRVQELPEDQGWKVTTKDWSKNAVPVGSVSFTPLIETNKYDRVVVAAGWYDTPFYPDAPGMDEAKEAGHIHHCKHYRDSTPYIGKNVVVVGNNNSANEVAAHLAPFNTPQHPIFRSSKVPAPDKCPSLPDERIKDVGMIVKYQLVAASKKDNADSTNNRRTKLDLTLIDGSIIKGVDYVILGTGYGQKYPWVHVLTDAARENGGTETAPLTPEELKGTRVPDMYNHALWVKSPRLTLGFVGLVVSTMPFAFNDLLSAWIAAVWSGKIQTIPESVEDRLKNPQARLDHLYQKKLDAAGPEDKVDPSHPLTYVGYHVLMGSLAEGPPSEFHFAQELYSEIEAVDPARTAQWSWKWDEEKEQKQNSMYQQKKQWLEANRERIRNDPFDILGTNNHRYGYLVDQLVHPSWRAKAGHLSEAKAKQIKGDLHNDTPILDLVLTNVPEMARKWVFYAYMALMGGLFVGLILMMLWLFLNAFIVFGRLVLGENAGMH